MKLEGFYHLNFKELILFYVVKHRKIYKPVKMV